MMKRYASIDVGSNSILLHIADYDNDEFTEVFDDAQIASLGKNIDKTKRFSDESMKLAFDIFENYNLQLEKYKVDKNNVFMIATEASRAASNSNEFFQKIENDFNLKVTIVSGEEEARFACLGAISGSVGEVKGNGLLLDIGGASTEVIDYTLDPFSLKKVISLPIGSVRATDWLAEECFEEKLNNIFIDFKEHGFKGSEIIAIAGTATSLMAMNLNLIDYVDKKVNGEVLDVDKLQKFVEKIQNYSSENLLEKYSFLGKRANVIIGGAKVLLAFCQQLKLERLTISTRGLRHGVLLEKVP